MKFLIVNFNTQKLVDALIRSINKFHSGVDIIIFDNSDKEPFNNIYGNVHVLDNTKGQIINFQEELSNLNLTTKNTNNNFGSLKHCLTIDKCIDLIDDGFILLDSDVLLKRNISSLWDKHYCTVGQISKGSTKWKGRIVPFANFINTEICKKHNIKYFNKNKIFGVKHDLPYYDTGSFFLEEIEKKSLLIKDINISEYIVHYGAGSYRKNAENIGTYKHVSAEEWLKQNKGLYTSKIVIYTSIIGGYDTPIDDFQKKDGYRYVLISDKPMQTKSWENIIYNLEGINLSNAKKQRYIKLHPFIFFENDTLTVYIDGNLPVNDKLYEYIDKNKDYDITFKQHPCQKCVYQECNAVVQCRKDSAENVNKIRERYQKEQMPKNFGMIEANIIIRKCKEWVKEFMSKWWKEIQDNSHRDQLSLPYVIWKNNLKGKVHIAISKDFNPRGHKQNNSNVYVLNQSNVSYNDSEKGISGMNGSNIKIRSPKNLQTKTVAPQVTVTLSNGMRVVRKATPKRDIDVYNKRPINKPKRIKNMWGL